MILSYCAKCGKLTETVSKFCSPACAKERRGEVLIAKLRAYRKKYRDNPEHQEKNRAYQAQYYQKNRESLLAYKSQWHKSRKSKGNHNANEE